MKRILREQAKKYAFDWRDEPLLRVACGESCEIQTYDASTGYFKTPEDLAIQAQRPGFDRTPPLVNPIAGPIWIEGAQRGAEPRGRRGYFETVFIRCFRRYCSRGRMKNEE